MSTSLRELIVTVSANTRPYQDAMQRASQTSGELFRTVQQGSPQAARGWDTQSTAAQHYTRAVEASSQAITRYIGIAAGAFGASRLIQMADDWGQLNARIQQATGSTAEFEMVQGRLEEVANRTYRRYSEAADQFAQTARPMRELGFAARDTLDAAEALGLALVAGGSNAQRGAAAQDAWAKSMVQGRIATDQFQTLMLQTPRVVQALADGLGKTTTELQAMAAAGQLTAQVVVPALISQMGQLSGEVERMPTTVQDATNRFLDSMQKWAGGANEATGATKTLVQGIELVAKNIDTIATVAISGAIGVVGSRMILAGKDAVQMARGVIQARDAQIALTTARVADAREAVVAAAIQQRELAARKLFYAEMMRTAVGQREIAVATRGYQAAAEGASRATAAHQASITALTVAENANAAAKSRLAAAGRMAMAVMGGPAGLAISVGLVAAGLLTLRSNTSEADKELLNLGGTVDEITAKFRELNSQQQAGAMLRLEKEISGAEREVAKLGRTLERISLSDLIDDGVGQQYRQQQRALIEEFNAGSIGADEYSSRLQALHQQLLANVPAGARVRDSFTRITSEAATAAREVERKRGVLGSLTQAQGDLAQATGNAAGVIAQQTGAVEAMASAAESAGQRIRNAIQNIPGQIARMGKSPTEIAAMDAADWVSGLESQNKPYLEVEAARDAGRHYVELIGQQTAAQKALDAATKARSQSARKEISDEEREAQRLAERYSDLIASQERQIALHGEFSQAAAMAYDTTHGALSALESKLKEVALENARWIDFRDDMAALEGVWADVAKDHATYADKSKDTFDRMSTYADQAARNMQTHFADYLFDPFEGGLSGMVRGFSDALRRMAAEAAASRIFEVVGQAMAGYSGQGGWGNMLRGIGGMIQTDGKRAGGGEVRPFSAYDVTEHGPELLTYGGRQVLMMGATGGVVSPLMNKAAGGATGGAPMQFVINNHGTNKVDVQEERTQGPGGLDIRRLVVNIVADDLANGGAIAMVGRTQWGWRRGGFARG